MNKHIAKAKAFWAGLNAKKRKIVRVAALAGLILTVVLLRKLFND